MREFIRALTIGLLLMASIVGITALGVIYDGPEDLVAGQALGYKQ